MTLFRSSLYTVFETTVSIKTFFPLKLNLISLCKFKGSSVVEASVFNDSRHSTGKASITEISLIYLTARCLILSTWNYGRRAYGIEGHGKMT